MDVCVCVCVCKEVIHKELAPEIIEADKSKDMLDGDLAELTV
jgi:hypothetical protein